MVTNKGGGGTQKDHVMGTWGGGGLVWVQICPRGLFTAPNQITTLEFLPENYFNPIYTGL